MATIKIPYQLNQCPLCGKTLYKKGANAIAIGSPLLKCKRCKKTYVTDLRCEWYKCTRKTSYILVWPITMIVLVAIMFLVGLIAGDEDYLLVGLFSGILLIPIMLIGWIFSLFKIIMSNRRMKRKSYLEELLDAGVIDLKEFAELSAKAK